MPRFDKTGPEGAGSLTGWGDGDCTDEKTENATPNVNTVMRGRSMWRRPFFSRWRRTRLGGRGRGGRGPGRGRRGTW